jgi:serine/threonine protein kinase
MFEEGDDKTVVAIGMSAPRRKEHPQNALPMGTRFGEFEIIDLVGEGGFGIVYLVWDHSLERKVAIKEYMPSQIASRTTSANSHKTSVTLRSEDHREAFESGRRSFVNEARLLAKFDHQALVKVHRFWEANGTAYMVMPYYAGVTLRAALRMRASPPDEFWIRKILMPVASALEVIHRDNCFHRDIAPDNIILQSDENPVLLDFGAARRVLGDMTQAFTVILKPGFAPVEQYFELASDPDMQQGAWTDIYALAAVIHFMILGKTPPPSNSRLRRDSYQPLATVAAGRYRDDFLRGVDRCLAVKAEKRPQTVAQMREALGWDVDFTSPGSVTKGSDPQDGKVKALAAGTKLALATTLVSVMALGGYWFLRGNIPVPVTEPPLQFAQLPSPPAPPLESSTPPLESSAPPLEVSAPPLEPSTPPAPPVPPASVAPPARPESPEPPVPPVRPPPAPPAPSARPAPPARSAPSARPAPPAPPARPGSPELPDPSKRPEPSAPSARPAPPAPAKLSASALASIPKFEHESILDEDVPDAEKIVHDSIIASARMRSWIIVSDNKNVVRLKFVQKKYAAIVDVRVVGNGVSVNYVSGENMFYVSADGGGSGDVCAYAEGLCAKGGEQIDSIYERWVKAMLKSVRATAKSLVSPN